MGSNELSNRPFQWMGVIFLGVGLLLGSLFAGLGLLTSRGEAAKPHVTGTVVDARTVTTEGDDGSTSSWRVADIEYEVAGTTYRFDESSGRRLGSTVTIVYDPSNPGAGHPAGSAVVFWILASALGIPFTVLGMIIVRWARSTSPWPASARNPARTGWTWGANPVTTGEEPAGPARVDLPADGTFPAYPTDPDASSTDVPTDLR